MTSNKDAEIMCLALIKQRNHMFFRNRALGALSVPSIDEAVSQNLETATFALS